MSYPFRIYSRYMKLYACRRELKVRMKMRENELSFATHTPRYTQQWTVLNAVHSLWFQLEVILFIFFPHHPWFWLRKKKSFSFGENELNEFVSSTMSQNAFIRFLVGKELEKSQHVFFSFSVYGKEHKSMK